MSEWITKPLQDIVSFQKGKKVNTSEILLDDFVNYLGAGSLVGNHDGYAATYNAVIAQSDNVLMLWDGERSGLVGHSLEGVVSSTVSKLTCNDLMIGTYLYYFLQNQFEWIQNRRTGTGVPHVPRDLSRILHVNYPKHKKEQQKIATILSTIDKTIERTEALIAKYQQIKAGMMHDLFTRGLLPDGTLRPSRVKAPELYKESAIGWIPKEWDTFFMSFITESIIDGPFGSNLKTEHYVTDPGIQVIRLQNISETEYNDSDKAYISNQHATNLHRNKVVARDILVAGLGEERYPVGRACLFPDNIGNGINKADCFRIRCLENIVSNDYVMFFLNIELARKQIRRYEQGVTRPRINTGNLKRLLITVPTMKEQEQVNNKISSIVRMLSIEKKYLNKLQNQKSGLMHDLLTGNVRVTLEDEAS